MSKKFVDWIQTDTGMRANIDDRILEIMFEDDDRWHGSINGELVAVDDDLEAVKAAIAALLDAHSEPTGITDEP